jgi:ribosomal protein S18 acetylase RimI-like enzyme
LRVRAASEEEHGIVYELVAGALAPRPLTRWRWDQALASSLFQADGLLVAEEGGRISGACLGALRGDAAGDTTARVAVVAVETAARRRGVGRALVEALAERGARAGARLLATRFCSLSLLPGVPPGEPLDFFVRLGFAATSRDCTIRWAPGRGTLASIPPDERIRVFVPADRQPLLRLIAAEFHPDWPGLVAKRLDMAADTGRFDDILVVEERGALIGFALGAAWPPRGNLGPIGVAAAARGQGLGRALVAEGVRHLLARGCDHVQLWTDEEGFQARRIYFPLGFEVVERWINLERPLAGR